MVGRQVGRGPLGQDLPLARAQRHPQGLSHSSGDIRLDQEHIGERRVKRLLPLRRGIGDVDQLRTHLHPP